MVKPQSVIPIFAVFACVIQDQVASAETDDEKFHQPFVTIYNDKEARHLWKVASSVYLANGSMDLFADCIYNKLKFSTDQKDTQYTSNTCTPYTTKRCAYLFGVDHNAKAIHFTSEGHGDSNFHEFIRDRLRPPRRIGDLLVHETAFLQYDLVWNGMANREFWELLHRRYPSYQFVLTGHQTGGFVAQLVAYDLITNGQLPASQVVVRTFGMPKGFLSGFPFVSNNSNIYVKAVPNSFHITRAGDDVPRQPVQGVPGWDTPVKEVYYSQGMKQGAPYTVCKSHDDPECSTGPGNTDTTYETLVLTLTNSRMAANEVYFGHHLKTACFADDDDA